MLCPAHLSLLREVFQMFRSSRCSGAFPLDGDVSSGLVSCSSSQLTSWAQQMLLLPCTNCQEPRSLSQLGGQHQHGQCLQKEGQKGVGRSLLETLPSAKRPCPVSCPHLFLLRQKLETRHPSLFCLQWPRAEREEHQGTKGEARQGHTGFWGEG